MGCRGIIQVLRDFSGWTSAHGLPHIGSAENCILRSFWTLVTLTAFGFFSFQMYTIVSKYFNYGVTMQTELKFEERVFPAVTICHVNPFKNDKLSADKSTTKVEDLVKIFKQIKNNGRSVVSDSDLSPWGFENDKKNSKFDPAAVFQRTMKWNMMLASKLIDDSSAETMAYSKDDMIMSCSYNTKTCNETDSTVHKDPYYGFCYVFNIDGGYSSTRAGPLYGLRMLIRTNQRQYLPYIRGGGIRVAVHGQNETAFPDALGLNAPPGFSTAFGIKFVTTKRKPSPYGTCTETTPSNYYYTNKSDYSVEACYRSCLQDQIISQCGCYDPMYNTPTTISVKSCAEGDTKAVGENIQCIFSKTNNYNVISSCKNCPQACQDSTYTVTISTARWPSESYQPTPCTNDTIAKEYWGFFKSDADYAALSKADKVTLCKEWYRKNTLLIEVYYERMNYQVLSESANYGIVGLISDTGGQLGLWLGVSFISVVEVCSLMGLLCLFCMSRKKESTDMEDSDDEMPKKGYDSSDDDPYDLDDTELTPPPVYHPFA